MNQKGFTPILVVFVILVACIAVVGAYFAGQNNYFGQTDSKIVSDIKAASDDRNIEYQVERVQGNYAAGKGGIVGSGFIWIARKEGGIWKIVWRGQEDPPCQEMLNSSVPEFIYGKCQQSSLTNFVVSANAPLGWETYTDIEWAITFNYPKNWFLFARNSAGIGDSIALANFSIDRIPKKNIEQDELRINIYREKTIHKSAETYINSIEQQAKVLSSEKITVSGIESIRQEVEGLGVNIAVYTIKNGYAYTFTASPSTSEYITIFDQILSTLKLLPSKQANDITPTIDPSSCQIDSDCGVNTCTCSAARKEFLGENSCMQVCLGEVKCMNNKCVLE